LHFATFTTLDTRLAYTATSAETMDTENFNSLSTAAVELTTTVVLIIWSDGNCTVIGRCKRLGKFTF